MANSKTPLWGASLLVLALLAFAYAAQSMWVYTLDDGFISMQYARQWLSGNGLVFTAGHKVEGFSNPLWVAVLAALGLSGASLPGIAKWCGLLSSACTIAFLWWMLGQWTPKLASKHNEPPHWLNAGSVAPGLATLLFAVHPGTGYYATSGLETPFYTCLLTIGIFAHVASIHETDNPRWYPLSMVSLALAAVTRPEGVMFLLLAIGHRVWHKANNNETTNTPIAQRLLPAMIGEKLTLLALLPPLGYLAFRLSYFGQWLPNTYYAKPGMFLQRPGLGASYIAGFFQQHASISGSKGPLLLVMQIAATAFSIALLWCVATGIRKAKPFQSTLLVFVVAQLAFVLYASGDWMIQHRLLLPILPALYALAALGLATVSIDKRKWLVGLLLLGFITQGYQTRQLTQTIAANVEIDHAHDSRNNVKAARWLASNTKAGETLVTDEIGALGFYTKLKLIDQWGLIDPSIANILTRLRFNPNVSGKRSELRTKAQTAIVAELMRRKPTYVLIDYRGPFDANGRWDERYVNVLTMPQLYGAIKHTYRYIRAFRIMKGKFPKSFLLFKRR